MEVLLFLLAIAFVVGLPIGVIVLLVGQSRLRRRMADAEQRIRDLSLKFNALPVPAQPEAHPVVASPAGAPAQEEETPKHPLPSEIAADRQEGPAIAATVTVSPSPSEEPHQDVPSEPIPHAAPDQNAPIVFRADQFEALLTWLRLNWFYVVSSASLALAGVFLVQYGIEKGFLPPHVRVLAALAFGAVLIGTGDWLRRRYGDDEHVSTAYLPSVFSAAGLVSIFAAIIAARQLYALIGPETALAGLVATSLLAVALGWLHGPLMVAMGLMGTAMAPFLVEGGDSTANWLYGYYALLAAMGLAVDAARRWAWVSVLALVLGYGGGGMTLLGGADTSGAIVFAGVLVVLATVIPTFALVPRHDGPSVLDFTFTAVESHQKPVWPPFPVRLAAGSMLASAAAIGGQTGGPATEAMLALGALAAIAVLYLIWAERADGLWDLPLLPVAVFLTLLVPLGLGVRPIAQEFSQQAISLRLPESSAPFTVTGLLLMAVAISAAAALRALRPGPGLQPLAFGLMAAIVAPVAAGILEFAWSPAPVLGEIAWALQIMALAAAAVLLASLFARADGQNHRRTAIATLAALSLISLSLFVMLTGTAFTLALAVLILAAAALDRRFLLAEMGLFIQIAVAVIGWRIAVDTLQGWADFGPLGEVLMTLLGVILAAVAALVVLRPLDRPVTRGALEALATVLAGQLATVLIRRWIGSSWPEGLGPTHWSLTLEALPWLLIALAQLHRAITGASLRRLRVGLSVSTGIYGTWLLAMSVSIENPLLAWNHALPESLVLGPPIVDSLAVAYALPALLALTAARWMPDLARELRFALTGVGAGLLTLYTGLEIRRLWQGPFIRADLGVTQPEMYSYTVALILVGGALLYQAIARRSPLLRRIATGVIGLAIAKVFLLDASGLSGLTRVASFLGLGLALAALAWLNRWAGQVEERKD